MYLSSKIIVESIEKLSTINPFFGITFLTCKKLGLPAEDAITFPMDSATNDFLKKYHKIISNTDYFFQPYKSTPANKKWVKHDYSAKSLQAINTQTFKDAFIHPSGSRVWGWSKNYINFLVKKLGRTKIPLLSMAIWIYKDVSLDSDVSLENIVERFLSEFKITENEYSLFEFNLEDYIGEEWRSEFPFQWKELRELGIPDPPDADPEQGGTLSYLSASGVGPALFLELEPAKRLSLITGDNGLGKSFLLDAAWWALTGTWAGTPIFPTPAQHALRPTISFSIAGDTKALTRHTTPFDVAKFEWIKPRKRPTVSGLSVYARVDGSFAVWDPAKPQGVRTDLNKSSISSHEAWEGAAGRIEGLIRDWVRWKNEPDGFKFRIFCEVLKKLSPPDLGELVPGKPIRIPGDLRDIPTLIHPYGEIPISYTSAGVRRIITLAYLIVWAWTEHLVAAQLSNELPQRRMVVLIDEIEAHLHPKWQRSFLPALLEVSNILSDSLDVQYIIATHSPLVMASSDAIFNAHTDGLFHLDLHDDGTIDLNELEYINYGDVSAWLTSPIFELKHARSNKAETLLEKAKEIQLTDDPDVDKIKTISSELKKILSTDDQFWPRWIGFAERYGIKL